MKKLIIAVAAAMLGIAANAAAAEWTWAATSGYVWDAKGKSADGGAKITSDAKAYLFDASYTQQSLLTALATTDFATIYSEHGIDAPVLDVNGSGNFSVSDKFSYGAGGNTYSYYAVVVADSMANAYLITETSNPFGAPVTEGEVQPISMKSLTSGSQAAIVTTGTFDGTHWYGAVPEPTSGLLLLLGVAGLALRRRRT